MEFLPSIIVIGLIIIVILGALRRLYDWATGKKEAAAFVCAACGTPGNPKSTTRGSIGIEIILWMCLFLPGLIYSIWRLSTRYNACPACGSREMIPANSPTGRRLLAQNEKP